MILTIKPSMIRSKPFTFIGSVLLAPIGIGLIILFIWWIKNTTQVLTVTDEYVTFKTGLFNTNEVQVYHSDITRLNVQKSLFNRLTGCGTVEIGTSATDGYEIWVQGVPFPNQLKDIINGYRNKLSLA